MDKIKHYQDVILDFLHRYNEEMGGDGLIERRIIADRDNNSFQLLSVGWRGSHFIFGPIFHFDIINGKIWMQCNNTEREVVDELMDNGVAKSDIVLGFVPPHARHFLGFAIA
jgi:XisI protein